MLLVLSDVDEINNTDSTNNININNKLLNRGNNSDIYF